MGLPTKTEILSNSLASSRRDTTTSIPMNMYKYIHCIPFLYPIDVLKMIGGQISLMFNLLGRMKNPAVDWPVLGNAFKLYGIVT